MSVDGRTLAVRAMQVGLVGVVAVGVLERRVGVVVNAAVPLAVTFLPALLERDYGLPMDPRLVVWLTTAVFLHAVGALGPYTWFGWYDAVTHTLSATVVAGAGYATLRALTEHHDSLEVPRPIVGGFIVVFVLAFGVGWEVLEFGTGLASRVTGGEPILAQYGVDDIANDLLFNAVGAVVVAVADTPRLRRIGSAAGDRL